MKPFQAYEFASTEWLAMVQAQLQERVHAAQRRDPGAPLSFSLCELFTDPPAHIGRGTVGWSVRVQAGKFEFFARELEDAQHKVIAGYDDILPLVRFRLGADAERMKEYTALGATLVRKGRIAVLGTLPKLPREFATLHDAIAERTL